MRATCTHVQPVNSVSSSLKFKGLGVHNGAIWRGYTDVSHFLIYPNLWPLCQNTMAQDASQTHTLDPFRDIASLNHSIPQRTATMGAAYATCTIEYATAWEILPLV